MLRTFDGVHICGGCCGAYEPESVIDYVNENIGKISIGYIFDILNSTDYKFSTINKISLLDVIMKSYKKLYNYDISKLESVLEQIQKDDSYTQAYKNYVKENLTIIKEHSGITFDDECKDEDNEDQDEDKDLEDAEDYYTSDARLIELSKSTNTAIKTALAANEGCPSIVYQKLSIDDNEDIRQVLARNENLPEELYSLMARDESYIVRKNIAKNRNVEKKVIDGLQYDGDKSVREASIDTLKKQGWVDEDNEDNEDESEEEEEEEDMDSYDEDEDELEEDNDDYLEEMEEEEEIEISIQDFSDIDLDDLASEDILNLIEEFNDQSFYTNDSICNIFSLAKFFYKDQFSYVEREEINDKLFLTLSNQNVIEAYSKLSGLSKTLIAKDVKDISTSLNWTYNSIKSVLKNYMIDNGVNIDLNGGIKGINLDELDWSKVGKYKVADDMIINEIKKEEKKEMSNISKAVVRGTANVFYTQMLNAVKTAHPEKAAIFENKMMQGMLYNVFAASLEQVKSQFNINNDMFDMIIEQLQTQGIGHMTEQMISIVRKVVEVVASKAKVLGLSISEATKAKMFDYLNAYQEEDKQEVKKATL